MLGGFQRKVLGKWYEQVLVSLQLQIFNAGTENFPAAFPPYFNSAPKYVYNLFQLSVKTTNK